MPPHVSLADRISRRFMRTKIPGQTQSFFFPMLCIFTVAIVLRFYRLPDTILFSADQGLDMVSVWQMQQTDTLPLVGPFLSIPNVYTPPTYYFVNWILYSITHSVVGMVYAYAVLTIITMALLVRLSYEVSGARAAILTGTMLSVSHVMIEHGRTIWQPYPVQLFLAATLLALWYAEKTRAVWFVWCGVFFYEVALSLYPSPVLLLPFMVVRLMRWYRHQGGQSPVSSVFTTIVTLIFPFFLIYSTQLTYEYAHGFPTVLNLFAPQEGLSRIPPIVSVFRNFVAFITVFFATDHLPFFFMSMLTGGTLFLIAVLTFYHRDEKSSPIVEFLPYRILFLGLCGFLVYPYEVHPHRAWAFLPIAFVAFAHVLEKAISQKGILRLIAVVLLGCYLISNVHRGAHFWSGYANDTVTHTKQVASFIADDIARRKIAHTDAGFFYKVPNDPTNGNYGIYRILFWLIRDGNIAIPLHANTIHLPYNYSEVMLKPYMYLICSGFASDQTVRDSCVNAVLMGAPYTELTVRRFQTITVVVLAARSLSSPSLHVPE